MKKMVFFSLGALVFAILAGCGSIFYTGLYFTVRYDANGATSGSVPLDAHRYREGDMVTLPLNTGHLAKTGCYFAGWSGAPGLEQGSAIPGEQFEIGEAMMKNFDPEIVMYAIFISDQAAE